MITRRRVLAAPLAVAAGAAAPATPAPRSVLRRAIDAAGGARALENARVLAWTGTARIHAGDTPIEIGVDTVLEPFTYARSETWLLSQGRGSTRVMEITSDGGWATRNGERTALPPEQTEHERQQYAIYGLMRFLPLLDDVIASVENAAPPADAPENVHRCVMGRHVAAPATLLMFDRNAGRLVAADNLVSDPGGEHPIAQRFLFSGTIASGRIRWPREMRLYQMGRLFFELSLETFTPRPSR